MSMTGLLPTFGSHRHRRRPGVRTYPEAPLGPYGRTLSIDTQATAVAPAIAPHKKWTQSDQDRVDEEERQKAVDALLQSWKERLSLITLISTFFAATEAQLLSSASPTDLSEMNTIEQIANAGLSGALVVHVFAAIISFLAAFFLIRYELCEALKQEQMADNRDAVALKPTTTNTTMSTTPDVWVKDPHLEHRGPWGVYEPPIRLLRKCNSLCMWLTVTGAVLALMGVVCATWATMPQNVSIFTSACAGFCLVTGIYAFL